MVERADAGRTEVQVHVLSSFRAVKHMGLVTTTTSRGAAPVGLGFFSSQLQTPLSLLARHYKVTLMQAVMGTINGFSKPCSYFFFF